MTDIREDYYFTFLPEFEKDNKHVDWSAYHATMNIVLTFSALDSQISRFLLRWDLFPSAYNLLAILHRTDGKGMSLSRISELLAVSRANVTGLIDVLSNKGLVMRTSGKVDRRVRIALLTKKGDRLVNEITPQYYEMLKGITGCISSKQQSELFSTLTRLRHEICEKQQQGKTSIETVAVK